MAPNLKSRKTEEEVSDDTFAEEPANGNIIPDSKSQRTEDGQRISFNSNNTELKHLNPVFEQVKLFTGVAILILMGIPVGINIFLSTIWELIDKKTLNLIGLTQKISGYISEYCVPFVRNKKDGFMFPLLVFHAVVMPAYFFYEMYLACTVGLSAQRILVYNLFRIGPMYMNFMWVYVLCHKEGHAYSGSLFCKSLPTRLFNYWVGMFQGVLPGVFTVSHIYNHHRYDNDENDVYSTAFRPRDDVVSWVKYIPEWMAYATNVSSFIAFMKEGRTDLAIKTVVQTCYFLVFFGVIAYFNFSFAMIYLFYPLLEGNLLLSVVNYTWHAFIDPDDPANDYVNSTTVVDGLNFALLEEYHVVHHQYAGVHWTRHKELYEKHLPEYKKAKATIFYHDNIFVIFGLIVSKNYEKLADLYYDPDETMDKKELAELMKVRLQCHGPDIAQKIGRSAKEN